MHVGEFLARLQKVRQMGEDGWMGCCPAHDDKNPSLSVSEGSDGRILLKCFAGCSSEQVVGAMGLKMADLMGSVEQGAERAQGRRRSPATINKKKQAKPVYLGALKAGDIWRLHKQEYRYIEGYDYTDAEGVVRYKKLRFHQVDPPHKKTFIQCVPAPDAGAGMWRFGRASLGVQEVLFNLPEVLATAQAGGEVWVVEGERDVLTAKRLGLVATCNSDGAGKWGEMLGASLGGCSVVYVIADKDPGKEEVLANNPKAKSWWQGQQHASDVVEDLRGFGIRVGVAVLPDLEEWPVKDLTDWVEGRKAAQRGVRRDVLVAELREIMRSAPEWDVGVWRGDGAESTGHSPHGAALALSGGAGHLENVEEEDDTRGFAWLRKELIAVMIKKETTPGQKKRSMAEVVCGWLAGRGAFYYDLADRGHKTAMWFDAVEKRLHRVAQDYFRSWLSKATAFSREFKDYKMFISAVEDEALVGDRTQGITPRRYWHREGDVIYLSCGEGRVVRIDAESVREVDNGCDGVVFEQGFTLDEWELVGEEDAVDPFEACTVFNGISTIDGRGPMLVRLWFCGMFGCTGWKPVLVFTGDIGSGKTRVATAFFELLGVLPPRVIQIDEVGNVKDFWTSVDKGGLFCLDNADSHIKWLAGALSVISTGGTFEKKKLYTDTDTITQAARCWAMVTSANPSFASDAGCSDRLITVQLERLEIETEESALAEEIAAARSPGLSWLCYIMQRALAWDGVIPKRMNRRHPDWAKWVFKLGAVAGYPEEAERAIRENEAYKAVFSIQNDALGKFLLEAVDGPFKGSGSELSTLLENRCEGFNPDVWTIVKIGRAVSRMAVALRQVFNFEKLNHSGRAVYSFDAPVINKADAKVVAASSTTAILSDVGDVREKTINSPSNINNHELILNYPNIPHIPSHKEKDSSERNYMEEFAEAEEGLPY